MASEEELRRWKAVLKHLQKHGIDIDEICRLWPLLTRIPVGRLERVMYPWKYVRSVFPRNLEGAFAAKLLEPEAVIQNAFGEWVDMRADIRAIPYADASPRQPGSTGVLGYSEGPSTTP